MKGRRIVWKKEMEEELLSLTTIGDKVKYSKKYNIALSTINKKIKELNGLVKTEKKIEIAPEKTIVKQKEYHNVEDIILYTEDLINKGVTFYLEDVKKRLSEQDKKIANYLHLIELEFESIDKKEYENVLNNIKNISRKRRIIKNEFEFINEYRSELSTYIEFQKEVKKFCNKLNNKKYTLALEEVDTDIIKSVNLKHNDEIEIMELKKENDKLIKELDGNKELLDRFIKTERTVIKMSRQISREKNEIVPIDKLDKNWRNLFNNLDSQTKNEILTTCYNHYSDLDLKPLKDLYVWEKILPQFLYEHNYFHIEN